MKKVIKVIFLVVALISVAIVTVTTKAVTLSTTDTPASVESGKEFSVTISFDEDISAFTSYLQYDKDLFTLSEENEIATAYQDNICSILYAPTDGKTTSRVFKINFKAKDGITEEKEAKFTLSQVSVTSTSNTAGTTLENKEFSVKVVKAGTVVQTNEVTPSTKETTKEVTKETSETVNKATIQENPAKLAKTGESHMILFALIIVATIAIMFKVKSNKLKKMFAIIPFVAIVAMTSANSVDAATVTGTDYEQDKVRAELIDDSKIVISPNKNMKFSGNDDSNHVKCSNNGETWNIQNTDEDDLAIFYTSMPLFGQLISGTASFPYYKTGDQVTISKSVIMENNTKTYDIIVYGDVNKDGNLCNAQDFKVVINSIIRINALDEISTIAADVTRDGNVNVIDLMRFSYMFKGRLTDTLVQVEGATPTPTTTTTNPTVAPEARSINATGIPTTMNLGESADVYVTIQPKALADQGVSIATVNQSILTYNQTPADENGRIVVTITASRIGNTGKLQFVSNADSSLSTKGIDQSSGQTITINVTVPTIYSAGTAAVDATIAQGETKDFKVESSSNEKTITNVDWIMKEGERR